MSAGVLGPAAFVSGDTGDDFAARFTAFPASPAPVDARDRALGRGFGLPPPPDAGEPAALRETWDRIFGAQLNMIEFVPPGPPLVPLLLRIVRRELRLLSTGGHAEDSGNWAGAYATATNGTHLGTMFGLWQVPPTLKIPAGKDPRDYSCSIWIGLDGQRRYFDSSLPQIGTLTQFCADGSRNDFAWVQWWERNSPVNGFSTLPLPVKAGDNIGAFLHVVDPLNVWFVIVNLSATPFREATAFRVSTPLGGAQPVVFGATAEWVLERPSHVGLKTKYDLPDFGQCQMEGLALQTKQIGAPLYNGDLRDMTAARMIRMLDVRAGPPRTAIIAMPHRAGPMAVNVTYGGFKR